MNNSPLISDHEIFLRMNWSERIQHYLLIITFFVLIITGLPLFFYEFKFFKKLLPTETSFYVRGIFHHVAAVVLILNLIFHLIYVAFTKRGRNNFKEMIPRFKDLYQKVLEERQKQKSEQAL